MVYFPCVPSSPVKPAAGRADAGAVGSPAPRDEFTAWLDSPVARVTRHRAHGQWYVVAEDFGIAGVGATQADAYWDVAGLLDAYLRSCFADGLSYQEALRPRRAPQPWALVPIQLRRPLDRIRGFLTRGGELVLPLRHVGPPL